MQQIKLVVTVMMAAVSVAPGLAAAQNSGTRDRERIIDVQTLTQTIQEAAQPVTERMESSPLADRFAEVQAVLEEDEVDKGRLLEALRSLQTDMEGFTEDWESVMEPLWAGQETIAQTIDRVRMMMAQGKGGEQGERTAAMVANYDSRLRTLAQQIQSETDPQRRERLRTVFQNVLSLRELAANIGQANLGPATEALQVRIIEALSALQQQLTLATFDIERIRVILVSESEFVGEYVAILEGMISAEELARALGEMDAEGTGISSLMMDTEDLRAHAQEFADSMNGFASTLVESIETETARAASRNRAAPELEDVDIDEAIRRYATPQP